MTFGAQRRRPGRRAVALVLLAGAVLAAILVVVLSGGPATPFAYDAAKRSAFEQRAAAGESHLLYVNSPGGVAQTAKRVAALDGPIRAAAATSHVDPGLIEGMLFLESGGRADAIAGQDPAAAAGVAQILPGTARSLLRMRVDLAASRSLTKQIAAAQQAHNAALAKQLAERRRAVDERFDPRKAIAATGRYLTFALTKLDAPDFAVESYHMGVGNLANAVRAYSGPGEHRLASTVIHEGTLTYAQLYFGSTPFHHAAAYRLLTALGDSSNTYYWRVLAAREIMRLFRQDPARLARQNGLQTGYDSGEAVLHPPGTTQVFADAAALTRARSGGVLRALPSSSAHHFAVDPAIAGGAPATLRPEALGVLYYLAARVYAISRDSAPLVVTAATRDAATEATLVARHAAPRGYSLYTTGYSFDVRRHYGSVKQAQAFQDMLDRLQSLDVIAWARRSDVIHVTASDEARGLVPLIGGAAISDES